jgi:hypothetical protein
MKVVSSFVFRTMMFLHNGKILTIDQLTHYEPNHSTNIDNIVGPWLCKEVKKKEGKLKRELRERQSNCH